MKLYTIGANQVSAEDFFTTLMDNKVKSIVDIRLTPDTMFCGFTKQEHFPYFLKRIAGIDYIERLEAAPTKILRDDFKNELIPWPEFKKQYLKLIKERDINSYFSKTMLNRSCLLCSESDYHHCHRKILGEYLVKQFEGFDLIHL